MRLPLAAAALALCACNFTDAWGRYCELSGQCDGVPVDAGGGASDGGQADAGDGGLARMDSLSDDFNDSVRAPIWSSYAQPGATLAEANGVLSITFTAIDAGTAYAGYRTPIRYEGRDAGVWITVVDPGDQKARRSLEVTLSVSIEPAAASNYATIGLIAGGLYAGYQTDAGNYWQGVAGVGACRMRIVEKAGNLIWSYSVDGGVWQQVLIKPSPIDMHAVFIHVEAGYDSAEDGGAFVAYDDFNR
jgi:hypothetical protein